jgi:hypothetical protein
MTGPNAGVAKEGGFIVQPYSGVVCSRVKVRTEHSCNVMKIHACFESDNGLELTGHLT